MDGRELRDSFELKACLTGAVSALLVGGVLEVAPKWLQKLQDRARPALTAGLVRIKSQFAWVLPGTAGWDVYRKVHPGEFTAMDVAALFDIAPDGAGEVAARIQASPELQDLLRTDDWWMQLRQMTSSSDLRAALLADLSEDVNFARDFKGNPQWVAAWEMAFNRSLPNELRLNPDFLRHYSKALAERLRIIDHLKGHINSNGSAKGCHFASEIDNVRVRLRPNQPTGLPSYFDPPANIKLKEAQIDIKDEAGNWVPKSERSTFFPDAWDEDRVLEEIARLQINPFNRINDRTWRGNASDGTVIEIRFTGADINNLEFSTIFPKY